LGNLRDCSTLQSISNLIWKCHAIATILIDYETKEGKDYPYYMVDQKRLGSWPLNTKTLVIKLFDDKTVDWMRIHE